MQTFLSGSVRAAAVFLAAVVCISSAYSQERRGVERREIRRERFHTDHWVFDHRFNHNHYYPQFGYSVPVLPGGHIAVTFRGNPFFFHSGVWYRRGGSGFVVVRPPVGIIVPVLPPAYSTVVVGSVPYYYANDAYYVAPWRGRGVGSHGFASAARDRRRAVGERHLVLLRIVEDLLSVRFRMQGRMACGAGHAAARPLGSRGRKINRARAPRGAALRPRDAARCETLVSGRDATSACSWRAHHR